MAQNVKEEGEKICGPEREILVTGKRTWKNVVLWADLGDALAHRIVYWAENAMLFSGLKHHCPRFYYQSQDNDIKILTD